MDQTSPQEPAPPHISPLNEPRRPWRFAIEEIDALDERARLAGLWAAVEARCPDAAVFVRWDWVAPWLEVFGAELRPLALVLRDATGEPAGIALLPRRRYVRHQVPVRQVFLGTAGESADDSVTVEFNHLLAPLGERNAVWRALLDHLCASGGFDEMVLSGLQPAELPLGELPAGWTFQQWSRRPCYAMDLRALRVADSSIVDALSANTRYQIKRSLRRYGGTGLVLEEAQGAQGALRFLDELVVLHQASWNARGQPGSFASRRFMDFHRAFIRRCPQRVQLLRLRDAEGQTIGIVYNFLDNAQRSGAPSSDEGGGTVYFYQSGLQQATESWQKPGLCLHFLAMEFNLLRGRDRYDFMASEARYKRSLSNSEGTLVWGAVQRPLPHLWLERAAVGAVRIARRARAQLSGLRSYITVSRNEI